MSSSKALLLTWTLFFKLSEPENWRFRLENANFFCQCHLSVSLYDELNIIWYKFSSRKKDNYLDWKMDKIKILVTSIV